MLQAGQRSTPDSERALEELCRTYWFPLYAYIRRRGYAREDAEDLTQAFFVAFLKKNYLERLSAERGRFRAFLLACLKHFLANEWDKSHRQKRGGSLEHLSLDWQSADAQFQVADNTEPIPDKAFDREWALALLSKVIDRLRSECTAAGHGEEFARLKSFLTVGRSGLSHAEVARLLGTNEGAARVAVHRLRKRYRQLLRDEISQTLTTGADVNEELRALFGAFA